MAFIEQPGLIFCVGSFNRENGIRSLGLSCIHTLGRGYPPEGGAHIALRMWIVRVCVCEKFYYRLLT